MKTLISVKDITKVYKMGEVDVHAVRGVSFDIYDGEFVVILGPSGSGKSTVLNIIGGIDTPTTGTVVFEGTNIEGMNEKSLTKYRREAVGFIFQFYNLIPSLTGKENIMLATNIATNPLNIEELLDDIGLKERSNHFPAQLSGGEQQRIAIARAIAKNPKLLLCDEPTGALDVKTGTTALKSLKHFNEKYQKTVIVITHNRSIGDIADRVIYFKDGHIDKVQVNENPKKVEEVSW